MACELRVVSMAALIARLEVNARREIWRTYTANTLWNLARGLAAAMGGRYDMEAYSEIMNGGKSRDNRTGAEIVADVLKLFD